MPTIHHGDCIETMNAMPPESVDAIVTDPPYGLGFMGKKWDGLPPSLEWAEACYRVLKPGGHIAAFGGTRTWHRLAVAIEDAGFEMRDSLAWLYGSGFPKSHDVGKAIDKLAGAEREVVGTRIRHGGAPPVPGNHGNDGPTKDAWRDSRRGGAYAIPVTAPATPEAAQWDGWGTALKPAFEPIVLARKPLAEKTVARNVLAYGTGAINVDACRIGTDDDTARPNGVTAIWQEGGTAKPGIGGGSPSGRWPANVLLDQHAAAWVDEQSGTSESKATASRGKPSGTFLLNGCHSVAELRALAKAGAKTPTGRDARATLARYEAMEDRPRGHSDSGGASRFFYTAKAPKSERPSVDGVQHPTVKPLAIMRWLIRLVTPPGGTVLDPFAGSGTTIEAALIEGFNPVGIEMETDYLPLIQHRIDRQAGTLTA